MVLINPTTSENEWALRSEWALRWALRDSNPRPQPCEGCALTS